MEKKPISKKILSYTLRTLLVILITVVILVASLYCLLFILAKGPSPTLSRTFVLTVKETSAGGFLADMFFTQQEINDILDSSANTDAPNVNIDSSLIELPGNNGETDDIGNDVGNTGEEDDESGIEVINIKKNTFNGKLMIVKDPSRVFVAIPPKGYGEDKSGLSVKKLISTYDAAGGINAGGFDDPDGQGTGGIPEGFVIYEGELVWDETEGRSFSVVGFDKNHILHVGSMTAERAIERELQYAVCFGPSLIINGTPRNEKGSLGGGMNPRTAIGQRADGAILMLVANGRQIDSLGATYDDLIDVMMEYGAINAANLDGGSSSLMILNDENLTTSAYIFGERIVPNAILVKKND